MTAAGSTARVGTTEKTSEALPVVAGEQVHARRRGNLGAEGGAPLTDFAGSGGAAADVGAHENELPGWHRRLLGEEAWG